MKILSSNVCGLEHSRAVNRLKNKVRQVQPRVLFLIETKLNDSRMEQVRNKCGFTNGVNVEAQGTQGGLSIGWKEGVEIQLLSLSANHINVAALNKEGMPV